MPHPILMPKPGQMTEECTLLAWHKQEGDQVRKGDVLFEIETDKSVMEVESFDDGVLLKRLVEEGQTVPVNAICAYVGMPGEAIPLSPPAPRPAGAAAVPTPAAASPAAVPAPAPGAPADAAPVAPGNGEASAEASRLRISPRASRLAAGEGIDPRSIRGTGPLGRITERDVRAALEARAADAAAVSAAPVAQSPAAPVAQSPAAPAAQAPVPAAAAAPTPTAAAPTPAAVPPAADETADEAPRPLSRMRRIIAERLTQSFTSTPHFTITVSVDVTRLLAVRQELKIAGHSLSVTDFVLEAVAQSLREFPEVNSRTDGESVWLRHRVHLGLAVTIPAGLVVPVIRDAGRLSVSELHDRAAALAEGARAGTLSPDDLQGSTFTVSNLGMFAVDEFSAIINPGEAAILAVSSALPVPAATENGIEVRQVMKLTLSADHRLVDGELGARFMNAVRRRLMDAESYRVQVING